MGWDVDTGGPPQIAGLVYRDGRELKERVRTTRLLLLLMFLLLLLLLLLLPLLLVLRMLWASHVGHLICTDTRIFEESCCPGTRNFEREGRSPNRSRKVGQLVCPGTRIRGEVLSRSQKLGTAGAELRSAEQGWAARTSKRTHLDLEVSFRCH